MCVIPVEISPLLLQFNVLLLCSLHPPAAAAAAGAGAAPHLPHGKFTRGSFDLPENFGGHKSFSSRFLAVPAFNAFDFVRTAKVFALKNCELNVCECVCVCGSWCALVCVCA